MAKLLIFQIKCNRSIFACLHDIAKVVVPFDGRVGIQNDVSKQLHPDDGVDEEQHDHQHHDVRKSLKIQSNSIKDSYHHHMKVAGCNNEY